jgi:hypothetical protein
MSTRSRRYTSTGGFGKTHIKEDSQDTGGSGGDLDIDFSITESGRTVAHLIAGMKQDSPDEMDFSISSSGRTVEKFVEVASGEAKKAAAADSQMDFIISKSGRSIEDITGGRVTRSKARTIPSNNTLPSLLGTSQQEQQQSNSYGSSGSAFVSGLMNQGALSHTPPAGSSYEERQFGKRPRTGVSMDAEDIVILGYDVGSHFLSGDQSVSGRLRSASDLEDKGIIDRSQKSVLKDLIISGDEQLQEALDKYEKGDKSQLEAMIKSGALAQKLPADMDLLGELDLDFLTVDDHTIGSMGQHNVEATAAAHGTRSKSVPAAISSVNSISGGSHFDGIGELEFGGDFGGDNDSYLRFNSRSNSIDLDGYRLRSNSMRSDVIDTRDRSNSLAYGVLQNEPQPSSVERWMDRPVSGKEEINVRRGPNAPIGVSGIGASLAEYNRTVTSTRPTKAQQAEAKRKERQLKKEQKEREKSEEKTRKEREKKQKKEHKDSEKSKKRERKPPKGKAKVEDDEPMEVEEEKVVQSGTGRPRSMNDPSLKTSIGSDGLLHVERPEGWVGAYSPESRKIRIERFLEKRNLRVWTKSVKYDVRKNFADSRLRVKGRFVKKEDELLMRELMSLT